MVARAPLIFDTINRLSFTEAESKSFRYEEMPTEENYDQAAADRFIRENSDYARFGGMPGTTGNKLDAPHLMWNQLMRKRE